MGKTELVALPFFVLWHVFYLSCLFALPLGIIGWLCSVIVTLPRHLLCYCPPPFRRKARGHNIRLSVVRGAWFVVRGSEFIVGTL